MTNNIMVVFKISTSPQLFLNAGQASLSGSFIFSFIRSKDRPVKWARAESFTLKKMGEDAEKWQGILFFTTGKQPSGLQNSLWVSMSRFHVASCLEGLAVPWPALAAEDNPSKPQLRDQILTNGTTVQGAQLFPDFTQVGRTTRC